MKETKAAVFQLPPSLFHRWPACPTSSNSRWSRWCRRRRMNPTPAYRKTPPTETTTAAPTDSGGLGDRTLTEPPNSKNGHRGPQSSTELQDLTGRLFLCAPSSTSAPRRWRLQALAAAFAAVSELSLPDEKRTADYSTHTLPSHKAARVACQVVFFFFFF